VNINDIRIKLYDNGHLTVVDAAVQTGFPNEDLFAKRGKELNFTLNKIQKMIRGQLGEPAVITINEREGNFYSPISGNDKIYIKESTSGADASSKIESLSEYKETLTFQMNDADITCPKFVSVNGSYVTGSYEICENDDIVILDYYTVEQLYQFMDIDASEKQLMINNHIPEMSEPVYENFKIRVVDKLNIASEQTLQMEEPVPPKNEESVQNEKVEMPHEIHISVNQTPITLNGKKEYVFVDIFDVYPFDTKKIGGTDLVTKVNGNRCAFLDSVNEGDVLEVYWSNE
jgi:hypothetical protein